MMKILKYIKGRYLRKRADREYQNLISKPLIDTIDPENYGDSLRDPSSYYRRSLQDFHKSITHELREHRHYFSQNQRGFGEDALHVMWWRLIQRFKPTNFLEIGVYRGQVISLVSLIAKIQGLQISTTGISPFSPAGDSVSTYLNGMDYLEDTRKNIRHFNLAEAQLLKAYSTDSTAIDLILSKEWDMIYIDGNHDYDIVLSDWKVCSRAVKPGGIIVLDDSGLTTSYVPPKFATAGHPGPSKLATEINPNEFKEILQVGHNRVFQKAI